MKHEQEISKLAFLNIKKKTNDITSNILFSVIAIVLGISLVTAMITGIQKLDTHYLLVYFVSIGWLAIIVMGTAYLLVRDYDKKSQSILVVIGIFTFVLIIVMYFTFS